MLGIQTEFFYEITLTMYEQTTYKLYVAINSNGVSVAVMTCF